MRGLIGSAKVGKVYSAANEIYVGKTERQKVYELMGEPNAEQQLNIGGITVTDIESERGEPDDKQTMTSTDETNDIYYFAPYELQFIVDRDDVTDYVSLRM